MACMTDLEIRKRIDLCLKFLEINCRLIDSRVLDFFAASHWSTLLPSWQAFLPQVGPSELASWIKTGEQKTVWPMSLIAFRRVAELASLDRKAVQDLSSLQEVLSVNTRDESCHFQRPEEEMSSPAGQHKDLLHVFQKHVKTKKQHEIFRLAKVCSLCSKSTSCSNVVDVGSGVGHLARLLHYGHDMNVACLEAEHTYSNAAKKFDDDFVTSLRKRGEMPKPPPEHIVCRLTPETDTESFHEVASRVIAGSLGLVGLHTCGDLGPSMIRYFARSPRIRHLVSVGCCYMKMDLESSDGPHKVGSLGFPMSEYVSSKKNHHMSYDSREISCHALEMYLERLNAHEVEKLKVHCYRAALECIIVSKDPALKRSGLKSVKNAHKMPFDQYALDAVTKLGIVLESADLNTEETAGRLARWQQVYQFYTLRLMLAPVVETTILLDRLLFLRESGFASTLLPLFDPILSARNLVLVSVKP